MTIRVKYNNKDWTLAQLAAHAGISKSCLNSRLECGCSIEEAVSGRPAAISANSVNSLLAKQNRRIKKKLTKVQAIDRK